jgi:hypothetical protein
VVETGVHDERGLRAFVIVRDAAGVEHYACVPPGASAMQTGVQIELTAGSRGLAQIIKQPDSSLHL